MRVAQWARLQTPARCGLRWGALRSTPPREWTVARTTGASDPYLVCPSCRHRAHLPDGRVATLRCPRCNELFTIAWDDRATEPASRATTPPSRDELKPDRRMTRRRMVRERRNGPDRREIERRATTYASAGVAVERRLVERREQVYRRSGWDRRTMLERRRRVSSW